MSNQSLVRGLMSAIERGERGPALAEYFDPDAEQVEYPSVMNPTGGSRGLKGVLDGAEVGARILASQAYEMHEFLEDGDAAAVRLTWRARTAADLPGLPAGSELTAHIAQFYEFHDGRVLRLRSYDCYEPFGAVDA
ncbi:nuclear transport factor 2 family protein [Agromyces sp. H66]|uniref:nuclear transport factor 2 family protein n=1 Tax=Agromyces sp. H66 TaxID=2529859 RepID=UPI0010AA54D9|nr:nuclear transport factor 2 family protein [Agromyces sp. H66]